MALRYPIILYFINGPVASVEDQKAAAKLGMGVRFRNATVVPPDLAPGAIEKCDGVSGNVPAPYTFYPSGDDVFNKWIEARDQGVLEFDFPDWKPPVKTKPDPVASPSLRHASRGAVEFNPGVDPASETIQTNAPVIRDSRAQSPVDAPAGTINVQPGEPVAPGAPGQPFAPVAPGNASAPAPAPAAAPSPANSPAPSPAPNTGWSANPKPK